MKVKLLKDVLISNSEVGASGQVYDLPENQAKALIKRKLAKEQEEKTEAASAATADPNKRQTKPAKDAPETK